MSIVKKSISWVLVLVMIVTMLPVTVWGAAAPQQNSTSIYGDLEVTLSLDYPVSFKSIGEADLKVTLQKDGASIVTVPLESKSSASQSFQMDNENYQVSVEARNEDGMEIGAEEIVSYYHLNFMQIPAGEYQIKMSGKGYTEYVSDSIVMSDYAKHILIGTGDGTFSIGDVNQDKEVTKEDLQAVENIIAKSESDTADLAAADLNKDGKVDITDLSYIYLNMGIEGKAAISDTKRIRLDFDQAEMVKAGLTEEDIQALFSSSSDTAVQLKNESNAPVTEEQPAELPIVFREPIEMEQITLESPLTGSAPAKGIAYITLENGEVEQIEFDSAQPEGIDLLTRNTDRHVVEINLGKKVAVKKVVIKITGTTSPSSTYADVAKVEFLKDIVPANPQTTTGVIKGFKAEAKDETVELSWNAVANMTGYKVSYGTESGNYTKDLTTETNKLTVSGLKNSQTYYFVVRATNAPYIGPASNEISATPAALSKPEAPSGLLITPGDGMLSISWNEVKSATHYHVYYREEQAQQYTKIADLTSKSYQLTGLTNDTKYSVYVTASNEKGESGPSDIQTAVPEKEVIVEPKVPTVNRIDSSHIVDVKLAYEPNVNQTYYPEGYNVRNVVDGDYNTHWTARKWWEDPGHIITFDQAYEMDYVVYVPRLDGNFKDSLGSYSITVWGPEDDLNGAGTTYYYKKAIQGYQAKNGYAVLTFPKTNVKQIKVGVHIWDGARTESSASEIIFYQYYSVDDDIRALFADDTYTTIAPTATSTEIERLRKIVSGEEGHYFVDKSTLLDELDMAEALLNQDNSKLGKVLSVVQGRSAGDNSNRGFSYELNDYQPLGIAAKAGSQLVVYASVSGDVMPELVVTQYYPDWNAWKATPIKLQQGRNIIEVPTIGTNSSERGGSIYLTYKGTDTNAKVHIKGGTSIPTLSVLDLEEGSQQEIKENIQQYIENLTQYVNKLPNGDRSLQVMNSTEIETPNVLLSLPASKVLEGIQAGGLSLSEQVDRVYDALLAWEEVVAVEYRAHGLSKDADEPENSWPTARINIRYTRMFSGAFMYASSGHIGIGFGSVPGMIQGKPTTVKSSPNALYGWGIAHEIGHVIDQRGRVYAETTNNIYSLFVQTYDGKDNTGSSRLEESDKYKDIYMKVSQAASGKPNDVFVGLGMYWQLHLAYDGAGEDSFTFYSTLHQKYRDQNYRATLPQGLDQDSLFAVIASDTVGKDLTPFFESWGLTLDDQVKTYLSSKGYSVEERALYYLNDEARRYRLSNKSGMPDDYELSVQAEALQDTKQVKLVITDNADADDMLGYEIYRNGKRIAFSTEKTYVDQIGAANNQSFTYEVVAYDKLLKASAKVKATPEVKIIHDAALPKDGWSYTTNKTNEIVIDMGSIQQTAGIKFNQVASVLNTDSTDASDEIVTDETATDVSYDYKVEVSEDGQKWTQAKVGMFDSSDSEGAESADEASILAYFNKPGADPSDTRIWTYDAQYIRITGSDRIEAMKENVDQAIDIISYPGDNIEISTDAIGYLKDDFVYEGADGEETIPAGTLVVTGSYRGDPVYNSIALKGLYNTEGQFGEEDEMEERFISGYGLMFAEIPDDGAVSETSDGFWLFVPEISEEATDDEEFPEQGHEASVLPNQIKAELYRSESPDDLTDSFKVSDTIWITSPDEQTMPYITLKGES